MKMVKKVLMGLALGAAVFSFVGCGDLLNGLAKTGQNDGEITGGGSKIEINDANDGDAAKRVYKATALKHAGGLIKVTFKSTDIGTSKMGVMFDLKDNKDGGNDFFVIGLNPRTDVANFYVSKFTNIKTEDYQATNFGASVDAVSPAPKEVEYIKLATSNNIAVPAAASDGSVSFYVFYYLKTDGNYYWAVLDMTDEKMKDFNSDTKFKAAAEKVIANDGTYTILKSGKIENVYAAAEEGKEATYYNDATITLEDGKTKVKVTKQNYIGYYGQIAAGKTLEGSWYVPSTTFHEAEDAE